MDRDNKSVLFAPSYVDARDKYLDIWIKGLEKEYDVAVYNATVNDGLYDDYNWIWEMNSVWKKSIYAEQFYYF